MQENNFGVGILARGYEMHNNYELKPTASLH